MLYLEDSPALCQQSSCFHSRMGAGYLTTHTNLNHGKWRPVPFFTQDTPSYIALSFQPLKHAVSRIW